MVLLGSWEHFTSLSFASLFTASSSVLNNPYCFPSWAVQINWASSHESSNCLLQSKLFHNEISLLVLLLPPVDIQVFGSRHVRNSHWPQEGIPQSGGLHCVYSRNPKYFRHSKYYSVKKVLLVSNVIHLGIQFSSSV